MRSYTGGRRRWVGMMVCAAALLIGGCGGYQLRGKVVPGPASNIQVVNKDDPRLNRPGMPGASVSVMIDPEQLNREDAGSTAADVDGGFALPIDAVGAGFLEYDVQVVSRLNGYSPAVRTIRLPGSDKRLLITLAPGDDRHESGYHDIVDETRRLGEPMMRR